MHIQAKATPAASPPDLETFLAILSEPVEFFEGDLNQLGNGQQVINADTQLAVFELPDNSPGTLLAAVRSLGQANLPSRRVIRHMVVGVETQAPNRFYVQIAFLQLKGG